MIGRRIRAIALVMAVVAIAAGCDPAVPGEPGPATGITYVRDALGRLEAVIDPAVGVARYDYDANGNVLSISRSSANVLQVIDFEPRRATLGSTITIYGTHFSTTARDNAVTIGGKPAPVVQAFGTRLWVGVPPGATTGVVSVASGGSVATTTAALAVYVQPTIAAVTAGPVNRGSTITISGTGFGPTPLDNRVTINGQLAQITAASVTSLTATVPDWGTTGAVRVSTADGTAVSNDVVVIMPRPYTTSDLGAIASVAVPNTTTLAISKVNGVGLFTFHANANDRVSARITDPSVCAKPVVVGPQGTTLWSGAGCGEGSPMFTGLLPMTESGTYTVAVPLANGETGSVGVQLFAVPADLALDVPIDGVEHTLTTTTPGQHANFTFTGNAGARISASITNPSPCGSANLAAPDGTPVWSGGGCFNASPWFMAARDLPQTGKYTLTFGFDSGRSGDIGTYRLQLFSVPPDLTTTIAVDGASHALSTTVPGQKATFTFSATTGQKISGVIANPSPCGSAYLSAPDGTDVWSAGGCFATSPFHTGTLTLAETGTYKIRFGFYSGQGADIGTFTAALSPASAGASLQAAASHDASPLSAAGAGSAPPQFETGLAGQIKSVDDQLLAGVSVSIDDVTTTTDDDGVFRLSPLTAGHHELLVDATHALGQYDYGTYEIGVEVAADKMSSLPYTIWLTRLDHAHDVTLATPTTTETVFTNPSMPGLEVHVPAGTTITDHDGNVVHNLSLTRIPLERTPFPLPGIPNIPLYFTIQPGASYVRPWGLSIVYPNTTQDRPGTREPFWSYDPDGRGWYIYGYGTVTKDGTQVVPDPNVRIWELSGAMFNAGLYAPAACPCPNGDAHDGDPVDLGTGLFVYQHTDLSLADVMPISLTRTYRPGDATQRSFGVGMSDDYTMALYSQHQFSEVDLVLPSGQRIHYVRTSPGSGSSDAVFETTATPTGWYGSKISWNGGGWNLDSLDGTTYIFGAEPARLLAVRDRWGHQVSIDRNANGKVEWVRSPYGRLLHLHYTSGRVDLVTDNIGRTVSYVYDTSGRLSKVTDASGTTTYGYNTLHQMTSIKDARGLTFLKNTYDANGRVHLQTFADNTTNTFDYSVDGGGKVTRADVTDANGNVRRVLINADGYSTSDTRAFGTTLAQATTIGRQPGTNFVLTDTDASGRTTKFIYLPATGRVNTVTRLFGLPEAATTTFTYEPKYQQLATVTDTNNKSVTFTFDSNGVPTGSIDAAGHSSAEVVQRGLLTAETDRTGRSAQYFYDGADLGVSVDSSKATSTYFVDSAGRVTSMTDPLGRRSKVAFDAIDRPSQVTDPTGATTIVKYNANNDVIEITDARNKTTKFTNDNNDRVKTKTDPLGHVTAYTYDKNGNVATSTLPSGLVTEIRHDGLNRVSFVGYGRTGTSPNYVFQSTSAYAYDDALHRNTLKKITDSANGALTRTYNVRGQVLTEATAAGTVGYTYDALGRLDTMTAPAQSPVQYGYDSRNWLKTITQNGVSATFTRDDAGRLLSESTTAGLTTTATLGASGRVSQLSYQQGATVLGSLQYGHNAAGETTQIGGSLASVSLPSAVSGRTYNDANELAVDGATTRTYDVDGNLKTAGSSSYVWNARGQLSSATVGGAKTSYSYDPLGRRVASGPSGAVYDGANVVGETGPNAALRLNGPGLDNALTRTEGGATSSYLHDLNGNVIGLASGGSIATRYSYEPYGAVSASGAASANTSQFASRDNDGNGLVYMRARYYEPATGQFISADPAGFSGSGTNLFRYAGSDPIDYTDPTGLSIFSWLHKAFTNARKFVQRNWITIMNVTLLAVTAVALCAAVATCGLAILGAINSLSPLAASLALAGLGAAPFLVSGSGSAPSFVPGDLFESTIESQAGNVNVLAEVSVSGSELTLSDIAIYGESGDLVNQVGARQFVALRDEVARQAAAQGFDTLRITGTRVAGSSSAVPGKVIDVVIDLGRFR